VATVAALAAGTRWVDYGSVLRLGRESLSSRSAPGLALALPDQATQPTRRR
jgi:hypothetical protein